MGGVGWNAEDVTVVRATPGSSCNQAAPCISRISCFLRLHFHLCFSILLYFSHFSCSSERFPIPFISQPAFSIMIICLYFTIVGKRFSFHLLLSIFSLLHQPVFSCPLAVSACVPHSSPVPGCDDSLQWTER